MYKIMKLDDIPKEPAERREWIKYQLRLKGYSMSRLAKESGAETRNPAIAALAHNYPKWERIIADAIGLKPEAIWPERYGSDGRPIKHSYRYPRNDSTNNCRRQRLTKKAV
jgi:Ner family transcriptional regulator